MRLSRTLTLIGKHPGVLEKIEDYLFYKRLNTVPLCRAGVICLSQAAKTEFGWVRKQRLNLSWCCSGKQRGMEENERTVLGWKATKQKKCERLSPKEKLLLREGCQKWKAEVVPVRTLSPTGTVATVFPPPWTHPGFKT